MLFRDRDQKTICAISTPLGVGGISVIRVSGPETATIIRKIAPFLPEQLESHRVYYGHLLDPKSGEEIDEILLSYFAQGRSFTGEDVVEISCHGNPLICEQVLAALTLAGAELARAGEFTFRAFHNGRIDLVQAESILDLIESTSKAAKKVSLRQLHGDLSKIVDKMESDLTWCLANIEAGIDFSTEGIDVIDRVGLMSRLDSVIGTLGTLVESFSVGRIMKDGLKIAIIGKPNVGKSSLLNLFLEEERAIVTNIAGTTRDVLSEAVLFKGQKFVFVDTAGIRENAVDQVEKLGIERSRKALAEADVVLMVLDSSQEVSADEVEIWNQVRNKQVFILINKSDILKSDGFKFDQKIQSVLSQFDTLSKSQVLFTSDRDKACRGRLFDLLMQVLQIDQLGEGAVLANARHLDNLSKAKELAVSAKAQFELGAGEELIAIELKQALLQVHEMLGKYFDDQIMDRVFKEFCIGK